MRMLSSSPSSVRPPLLGICWDMDGTLTVPNLDFKVMYERCGVPITEDILVSVSKMPPNERAEAERIIEEMEEEGRKTLALQPGAAELMRFLHDRGLPMAIITRNTGRTVSALTSLLQKEMADNPTAKPLTFDPVISRDVAGVPAKPDPQALRLVAEAWGVTDPSQLLMIGDSPANDVAFGKAAGARTLLLDTGRRHTEGGSTGDADLVVSDLNEVPSLLMAFHSLPPLTQEAKAALNDRAPPLRKFAKPEPKGEAALAAVRGDVEALRALHAQGKLSVSAPSGSVTGGARATLSPEDPSTWPENSALIWAVDAGQLEAVEFLMQLAVAGDPAVDVNHRGFLGATALARACRHGNVDALRLLLRDPSIDLNQPNVNLQAPLHFAAFKKHPAAVRAMLEAGADTRVLDRKERTPAEDTSVDAIREAVYAVRRGEGVGEWLA